ncbi:MAG: serine/threonine protein kinase [Catenulispora sp.]|nr:serine/threonine protein kinase [Catenulispora sp.]
MTLTAAGPTVLGGRYRLGARIALGGSAEVYEAVDVRLARRVAVKLLLAADRGPDQVARFTEEARLLAAVGHPHLVPLLDAGLDGDRRYLVMPLIGGEDLARIIRRGGPLPPPAVARVGLALAEALAHIHARGIVHRDLKPANVLMEPHGGIYLADFGIAHAWDGPQDTATGCVVGTAGYLAPEQARGNGAMPASDVFSLGLILLEALTGRPEYTGPPMERLAGVIHRPPQIPPGLPPQWRALLASMLCPDPVRRPTAGHLRGLIASPVPMPMPVSAPAPLAAPPASSTPPEAEVYHRPGWTPGGRHRSARAGRHASGAEQAPAMRRRR